MTFETRPDIKPPVQLETWTDPISGIVIPMQREENLLFRREILKRCEADSRFKDSILMACKESPVLWVSIFAWTFKQSDVTKEGKGTPRSSKKEPFIPWPEQVIALNRIHMDILQGESTLWEKSREIGASWMFLLVFTHQILFRRDVHISMLSRIEEDVDQLGGDIKAYPFNIVSDPGTLFGKVDFILNHLPAWQMGRLHRKRLHLVNQDNGSRLDGGASGVYTFSGQRRDAILFDEAAKNANFKTVWEQTTDVSLARFPVSTPIAGAYFSRLRYSGQIKVETFGWWFSPEKAIDLDALEVAPDQWKLTSSWYRLQCTKRSPNDIATNLDISHIESGSPFFEGAILARRKKENCRPPLLQMRIEFRREVLEHEIPQIILRRDLSKVIATIDPKGPWLLWMDPPIANPRCKVGEYNKVFSGDDKVNFGIDIALGMGASNSVISVVKKKTRHKIAEYASAQRPPHAFAKDVAAAALWFGAGVYRPLLVPEANGTAGFDFMRQVSKIYSYPEIYRATTMGRAVDKQTDSLGFSSSRIKKAALLGNLRREYAVGKFINPSEIAVTEAGDYIVADSGAIEPAYLSEESESVKAAHGDRVIADALALWPGSEQEVQPDAPREYNSLAGIEEAPYGSQGYRMHNKSYVRDQKDKNIREVRMGQRFNIKSYLE